MAVKHLVSDEEFFLANYSDGLTDAPLPDMIERFKNEQEDRLLHRGSAAVQLSSRRIRRTGMPSNRIRSSRQSEVWINGGYFIFRNEIFDYIRDGEELVLEPFNRLIEEGSLMAYKYEGFWRAMDTLRDGRCSRKWSSAARRRGASHDECHAR